MFGSLYSCCNSMLLLFSYCCVVLFCFGLYILLNIRFSKIAILSSSPLVVGYVSQTLKRTGLIITLYSIIFNLIDCSRKVDKRYRTPTWSRSRAPTFNWNVRRPTRLWRCGRTVAVRSHLPVAAVSTFVFVVASSSSIMKKHVGSSIAFVVFGPALVPITAEITMPSSLFDFAWSSALIRHTNIISASVAPAWHRY